MTKTYKVTVFCWLALFLLVFACGKKNGTKPEPPKYKWTILGYFDGNNPQDQTPAGHSYVIHDEQELEHIDSTQDIQVVVMLGSFKTGGICKYYHIQSGLDKLPDSVSSEVLKDLGNKDMSDPATLRDFISYGVEKYPAEHYMLIVNDHTLGWKGLCSDQINGSGNWMSLPELSFALSGFYFDIIWFYTPSLATAEVAYQIKDRAKYMIASQYLKYPDNIMGAAIWLPYLTDTLNPNIEAVDLARKIPEAVDSAASLISSTIYFHIDAINLSKLSALATDISNLGASLVDYAGSNWGEVWDAWDMQHHYEDMDSFSVDLLGFAQQIQSSDDLDTTIKKCALQVVNTVNAAVISQYMFPVNFFGGISIYLPWNHDVYDSVNYAQLYFSETEWESFLSVFIQSYSVGFAGAFDIKSTPTGAEVFLNGVDTGDTTNVFIGGLYPGAYNVTLTKTGYKDFVIVRLNLPPQETITINATLKPVF